ncbi:MAG: PhzF family phenazine biosynthesis protein, partial [Terriglobia bacterium]
MRAKLKIVDVFTRVPFAGNPAGVVWEEAGLKTEQMQKIAREVNHSETVFLVAAKQAGCFGARFFTPTHELPVAGHPTVALFHSLAEEQVIEGSERATFRQETGAGVFPIELKGGREGSKVFMGQAKPRYEKFAGSVKELGQALGLGSGSIDDDLEPEIVSTGMSHLIVGVNDGQTLDSAEPDANMLAGINNDLGVATTHVFAADAKRP